MHPLIMEDKHIICSNTEYNYYYEEMKIAKVIDLQYFLVDYQRNWDAEEYLNDYRNPNKKTAYVKANENE